MSSLRPLPMTHATPAAAPAGALDADEADRLAEAFQPTWEAEQGVAEAESAGAEPAPPPDPRGVTAPEEAPLAAASAADEESLATTVSMPPPDLLQRATAPLASTVAFPVEGPEPAAQSLSKTVLGGIIPPEARAASVDVTAMYVPAAPIAPPPPQTTRMLPSSAPPGRPMSAPPAPFATAAAHAAVDSSPSFDDLAFKPKPASRAWIGVAAVVAIGAIAGGIAFLRGASSGDGEKTPASAPAAQTAAAQARETIPPPPEPSEEPTTAAAATAPDPASAARTAERPPQPAPPSAAPVAATPQAAQQAKAAPAARTEQPKSQASTTTTRPHGHASTTGKGGSSSKSSTGGIVRDNPF